VPADEQGPRTVSVCVNLRRRGLRSCGRQANTRRIVRWLRARIRTHANALPDEVVVATVGCFGRCAEGPILCVQPDRSFYTYRDEHDIDEIVAEQLVRGVPLARLALADRPGPRPAEDVTT
jgi:(2Fe-2S) ferredoxin